MDSVRDFKTFFPYTAFKGITHFKQLYQVFFLNKEKHKWPLNFEWIVHNTSKHQYSFFLLSSNKKIPLLSSLKVNFSLKKKEKQKNNLCSHCDRRRHFIVSKFFTVTFLWRVICFFYSRFFFTVSQIWIKIRIRIRVILSDPNICF